MDQLWSPWRYRYVTKGDPPAGCIFCRMAAEDNDEKNLVLLRGRFHFAVLNLFPYTSGHLMIVPYAHTASLEGMAHEALSEMMELVQRFETVLKAFYKPQGLNIGMNLGECAGAGIAQHVHMHVLPRWFGDSNFMTVVGETRVHIEELAESRRRIRLALGNKT